MLLVFLGGALGLLLASWATGLLVNFISTGRDPLFIDAQIDARVLLFTLLVWTLTRIGFDLAPSLRLTRTDAGSELKLASSTVISGWSSFSISKLLIIGQISLSLVLLVGAGLFIRTLKNLKNLDAGFKRDGVLTMALDASARDYPARQFASFWRDALSRVNAIPNVTAAASHTLRRWMEMKTVSIFRFLAFRQSHPKNRKLG